MAFVPDYVKQYTQQSRIIWYIQQHGWINRSRAGSDIKVAELSSRIGELEKRGYVFDRKPGEGRMVVYTLIGGPGIGEGQLSFGLGLPAKVETAR